MAKNNFIQALPPSLKKHAVFLLLLLFVITSSINKAYKHYFWENPSEYTHTITSDGTGYYAYLPQTFIYHTNNFEFDSLIKSRYPKHDFFSAITIYKGVTVDKYPIGNALLNTPFFLTAHAYCLLSNDYLADGYSMPYEKSIFFGALFYCIVGLLFLYLTLQLYSIHTLISVVGLGLLFFGTNLSYYTITEPSLSHVTSFASVAAFLYFAKKYTLDKKNYQLILVFLILGLVTITRATNFLSVLIIPFLFTDWKTFLAEIKALFLFKKKYIVLGFILFLSCIFLQFNNIHNQIGVWAFNNYNGEKFDYLFNPQVFNVLFSYRKGFFVYTPLFILFPIALIATFKQHKYLITGITLFSVVFIYIMASWWCWYYGGSYGMRPMIDVYSIIALPIFILAQRISLVLRLVIGVFGILCCYYTSVQIYQMQEQIMHYHLMNKERFWQIFLKKDDRFKWIFFQEDVDFDPATYQFYGNYAYNLGDKDWHKSPKVNQSALAISTPLPYLIFTNDGTWKNTLIGVKANATTKVMRKQAILKTSILGFKDGETHYLSYYFFGQMIPRIGKFYDLTYKVHHPTSIEMYDSVAIYTDNSLENSQTKKLNYEIYFNKKLQ